MRSRAEERGLKFIFCTGKEKGEHTLVVKESRKNDFMHKQEPQSFFRFRSLSVMQIWAVTPIVRATHEESA